MDIYDRIQNSLNFIEENLINDFSLKEVANRAYCSLSYFHYVFHTIVGISLKEYIRKRRLVSAAYELISTKDKVLDIAFKYQYETAESFTRAFTKMFGVTPSSYRKSNKHQVAFQKLNLLQLKLRVLQGGYIMEPKIIEKEEMKVIGIELKTSFDDTNFSLLIKDLWNKYINDKVDILIPHQVSPTVTLGLNMDFNSDGSFSYVICKEVDSLCTIPNGMVGKVISKSKYAVFTARGNDKSELGSKLGQIWNYFFETWLPNSGYTQEGLCSPSSSSPYNVEAAPNFELYDERYASNDSFEVDVYIPIK